MVRARLMAEQTVLYGEYDRAISEAEFRVGVLVPLVPLVTFLAFDGGPLWLLSLLPLSVLLAQAVALQVRANLSLVESVISGKIASPYLEELTATDSTGDASPSALASAAEHEAVTQRPRSH